MHVAAINLPPPTVAYFDLAVAGRCPVADDKLISEAVLHSANVTMIIIEDRGVALTSAAVVDDDVLPAPVRDRGAIDLRADRRAEITISAATGA